MIAENIIPSTQGPGDPPAAATVNPPTGYVPTNPQQRTDWNGFLDFLNKQKDVNTQQDPDAAATMMDEYKKQNPNFSVTPQMLPNIQYEQQQFRTGNSFPGLTPDQLIAARTGMSPNFINQTDPNKSYYPQFKVGSQDFGTDAEGYAKSKSEGGVASPPVSSDPPVESAGKNKDAIPVPDYSNASERTNYLKAWQSKYGPLEGRGDTVLKVNEVPRTGTGTAKNISTKAASQYGIDPALLYSSAMEEGMSGLFKNQSGNKDTKGRSPGQYGYQDYYNDKDFPINGGQNFGFQTFAERFPDLVKKGYLPQSFASNFRGVAASKNDEDPMHDANNFKTADAALQAKAAMLKYHYDEVDSYAKKNGIELSPKARDFFALAEYNGGEGTGHQMMTDYNKNGLLQGDKFLESRPTSGQGLKQSSYQTVYQNVSRRLKMRDNLKKEGLF